MRNILSGVLGYFVLSLVLVNQVSAGPSTPKVKRQLAQRLFQAKDGVFCENWNCFLIGTGAMFDSDGGSAGAFSLTYVPSYYVTSALSVKGYAGGMLSNVFVGSNFGIGELALTLKYDFLPSFAFEAGGGIQFWTGTRVRSTYPQIKGVLGFDVFQITYSCVLDSLLTTHQVLGAISFKI